jgi:anti-anti-sigma regulatory factor
MEFKIDTKSTFSVIKPLTEEIDAKLADALLEKCEEMRQSGSKNFIIDMQDCKGLHNSGKKGLVALHEEGYSQDSSIVFTGLNNEIMESLKDDETDLLINIAPKMAEAIDIITMEILERDLFNEES